MGKSERYFIVFYVANSLQGQATGNLMATTEDGAYLSCREVVSKIKDVNKSLKLSSIAITNIIELSEIDYLRWQE